MQNNHSFWWWCCSRSPSQRFTFPDTFSHHSPPSCKEQLWRVERVETPGLCIFSNSCSADVSSPPWCLPLKPHFLYIKAPPLWGALVGKNRVSLIRIDALIKQTQRSVLADRRHRRAMVFFLQPTVSALIVYYFTHKMNICISITPLC